jgi:hypothetical protein
VVIYWAHDWRGYIFAGYTWSATDQLMPLYAILASVIAAGTRPRNGLQWA